MIYTCGIPTPGGPCALDQGHMGGHSPIVMVNAPPVMADGVYWNPKEEVPEITRTYLKGMSIPTFTTDLCPLGESWVVTGGKVTIQRAKP